MQRLTLAERVEHFKGMFPKHPASWPWLVKEKGLPVFYAVWLGGGDYTNKTRYHGAYPHGYLQKLLAFFPDIPQTHVLHAFSGSLPKGDYLRIDLKPETEPDIVGNIYDVADLVGARRFRLICADRPYTPADAKKYGTPPVVSQRACAALAKVAAPRGFMAWLDQYSPIYSSKDWRVCGRIFIDRSTGHRIRKVTLFERVGVSKSAHIMRTEGHALPAATDTVLCAICGSAPASTGRQLNGLPEDVPACTACREAVSRRDLGVTRSATGLSIYGTDGSGRSHPAEQVAP